MLDWDGVDAVLGPGDRLGRVGRGSDVGREAPGVMEAIEEEEGRGRRACVVLSCFCVLSRPRTPKKERKEKKMNTIRRKALTFRGGTSRSRACC